MQLLCQGNTSVLALHKAPRQRKAMFEAPGTPSKTQLNKHRIRRATNLLLYKLRVKVQSCPQGSPSTSRDTAKQSPSQHTRAHDGPALLAGISPRSLKMTLHHKSVGTTTTLFQNTPCMIRYIRSRLARERGLRLQMHPPPIAAFTPATGFTKNSKKNSH